MGGRIIAIAALLAATAVAQPSSFAGNSSESQPPLIPLWSSWFAADGPVVVPHGGEIVVNSFFAEDYSCIFELRGGKRSIAIDAAFTIGAEMEGSIARLRPKAQLESGTRYRLHYRCWQQTHVVSDGNDGVAEFIVGPADKSPPRWKSEPKLVRAHIEYPRCGLGAPTMSVVVSARVTGNKQVWVEAQIETVRGAPFVVRAPVEDGVADIGHALPRTQHVRDAFRTFEPGRSHYVKLCAVDAGGNRKCSAKFQFTTPTLRPKYYETVDELDGLAPYDPDELEPPSVRVDHNLPRYPGEPLNEPERLQALVVLSTVWALFVLWWTPWWWRRRRKKRRHYRLGRL